HRALERPDREARRSRLDERHPIAEIELGRVRMLLDHPPQRLDGSGEVALDVLHLPHALDRIGSKASTTHPGGRDGCDEQQRGDARRGDEPPPGGHGGRRGGHSYPAPPPWHGTPVRLDSGAVRLFSRRFWFGPWPWVIAAAAIAAVAAVRWREEKTRLVDPRPI